MYYCLRCKTRHSKTNCPECGKHKDRPVRKSKRSRPIGGKRGRNSGTVGYRKSKN